MISTQLSEYVAVAAAETSSDADACVRRAGEPSSPLHNTQRHHHHHHHHQNLYQPQSQYLLDAEHYALHPRFVKPLFYQYEQPNLHRQLQLMQA